MNDGQRFQLSMSQIGGKRLTYSEFTGKDQSPRHEAAGTRETQVPFEQAAEKCFVDEERDHGG
jgi:hypothetical protein